MISYDSLAAVMRGIFYDFSVSHPDIVKLRKKACSAALAHNLEPYAVALDLRAMLDEGFPLSKILDMELVYESSDQGAANGR